MDSKNPKDIVLLQDIRSAYNKLMQGRNLLDPVEDHRNRMYWDGCLKTMGAIIEQLEMTYNERQCDEHQRP